MSRRCKVTPLACKICKVNDAEKLCDLCQKIVCMECLNLKVCKNCSKDLESFRKPRKVLENEIEVTVKGNKCWNCITPTGI